MIKSKEVYTIRGRDENGRFDNTGHPTIILHDLINKRIKFINKDINYLNKKSYTDEFVLVIRGTRKSIENAGKHIDIDLKRKTKLYTKKIHLLHKDIKCEKTYDRNGKESNRIRGNKQIISDNDYKRLINFILDNEKEIEFYHPLYLKEIKTIKNKF